jgi:hypothetical protein
MKVLLLKSISDILGQFAFVRAKQPSAPILFDQKLIVYTFSALIFAICLHPSFPKDLLPP